MEKTIVYPKFPKKNRNVLAIQDWHEQMKPKLIQAQLLGVAESGRVGWYPTDITRLRDIGERRDFENQFDMKANSRLYGVLLETLEGQPSLRSKFYEPPFYDARDYWAQMGNGFLVMENLLARGDDDPKVISKAVKDRNKFTEYKKAKRYIAPEDWDNLVDSFDRLNQSCGAAKLEGEAKCLALQELLPPCLKAEQAINLQTLIEVKEVEGDEDRMKQVLNHIITADYDQHSESAERSARLVIEQNAEKYKALLARADVQALKSPLAHNSESIETGLGVFKGRPNEGKFQRSVRDMTPEERRAALNALETCSVCKEKHFGKTGPGGCFGDKNVPLPNNFERLIPDSSRRKKIFQLRLSPVETARVAEHDPFEYASAGDLEHLQCGESDEQPIEMTNSAVDPMSHRDEPGDLNAIPTESTESANKVDASDIIDCPDDEERLLKELNETLNQGRSAIEVNPISHFKWETIRFHSPSWAFIKGAISVLTVLSLAILIHSAMARGDLAQSSFGSSPQVLKVFAFSFDHAMVPNAGRIAATAVSGFLALGIGRRMLRAGAFVALMLLVYTSGTLGATAAHNVPIAQVSNLSLITQPAIASMALIHGYDSVLNGFQTEFTGLSTMLKNHAPIGLSEYACSAHTSTLESADEFGPCLVKTRNHVDSGSTSCCLKERLAFTTYQPCHDRYVIIANGQRVRIAGIGTARVGFVLDDGSVRWELLQACLHVPQFSENLLSIRKLWTLHTISTVFDDVNSFVFPDKRRSPFSVDPYISILVMPSEEGRLSRLDTAPVPHRAVRGRAMNKRAFSVNGTHRALGHCGGRRLRALPRLTKDAPKELESAILDPCDACLIGESPKLPSGEHAPACDKWGSIVMDFAGPLPGKFKYLMVFTDLFSRYRVGYLAKSRDEAPDLVKRFLADTRSFGTVCRLHSDNEFRSNALDELCLREKIKQSFSTPHSPTQNGVAERQFKSIFSAVRKDRANHPEIPKTWWCHSAIQQIDILNRTTEFNGKTPFEHVHGQKPRVMHFREMFITGYMQIPEPDRDRPAKVSEHGIECIHCGYSRECAGYICYVKQWGVYRISSNVTWILNRSSSMEGYQDPEDDSPADTGRQLRSDSASPNGSSPVSIGDPDPTEDSLNIMGEQIEVFWPKDGGWSRGKVEAFRNRPNGIQHHRVVFEDPDGKWAKKDLDMWMKLSDWKWRRAVRRPQTRSLGLCATDGFFNWTAEKILGLSANASEFEKFQPTDKEYQALISLVHGTPTKHSDVERHINKDAWIASEIKELDNHKRNGTVRQKLLTCDLPEGASVTGSTWSYKEKTGSDGQVCQLKSRWCCMDLVGVFRFAGIDFDSNFSTMLRNVTFRMMVAASATNSSVLHNIDFTAAFLQEKVPADKRIFVKMPPGYVEYGYRDGKKYEYVYELDRYQYGLQESSRAFQLGLRNHCKAHGFNPSWVDPNLFIGNLPGHGRCLIGTYVDDCLISAPSEAAAAEIKRILALKYEFTDSGPVSFFLGANVQKTECGYHISHSGYIQRMVDRFIKDDKPSAGFPLPKFDKAVKRGDASVPCTKDLQRLVIEAAKQDKSTIDPQLLAQYRSLLGALLYCVVAVRADAALAVGLLSRATTCPTVELLDELHLCLLYLKSTQEWGIQYDRRSVQTPVACSDSDWSVGPSTTAYVIQCAGGLVAWKSVKQACITMSSSEAELVAANAAALEVVFVRHLYKEIHGSESMQPTDLHIDNRGTVHFVADPQSTSRMKHVARDYLKIRELIQDKLIKVHWIETTLNPADLLTKWLQYSRFASLRSKLMRPAPSVGGK